MKQLKRLDTSHNIHGLYNVRPFTTSHFDRKTGRQVPFMRQLKRLDTNHNRHGLYNVREFCTVNIPSKPKEQE